MKRAIVRAPGTWMDVLSWAAIIALLATIALGILVPVYVDEIATKLVQARFLSEHGEMLSLFPQCASGFVLDTPLTWYPAALAFSLFYGGLQPVGLRLAGTALFLAWLALLAAWLFLTIPEPRRRLRAVAAMAALVGLGVLPLTMVLARPEQWVVLLLTCYLVLAAGGERAASRARVLGPAAVLAAFALLTSLLNYSHPKALFFLPFVLICAYYTFGRRRQWLIGLAAAFSLVSAYQTFEFAKAATRCEEAPILSGILSSQTTRVSLAIEDPVAFLGEAASNLASAPGEIAAHGVFQSAYQSAWLPPVPFAASGTFVKTINLGITGVWYLAFLLAVLLPPVVFFLRPGQDPDRDRRLLFPALWIGLVGHLALYKEWNFYGGAPVVAIAGLLLVHGFGRIPEAPRLSRLANGALVAVLVLALASTGVLAAQLGPRLLRAARSGDVVPVNQELSLNAFVYAGTRDQIRSLAEECGLPGDGATRLVVDDLSYFAFTGLHQPMHLGFLQPSGFGADIAGRTRDFLSGMQSDGIIARCSLIPPEFRYQTLQEGNLCCVDLKDRSYF
ncbi:MAG: hypothetical protein OEW88_06910 [Gammaproteobacteria bacterium]|nr:hypothetical protein [Gammaproteobacteria bacterium]